MMDGSGKPAGLPRTCSGQPDPRRIYGRKILRGACPKTGTFQKPLKYQRMAIQSAGPPPDPGARL